MSEPDDMNTERIVLVTGGAGQLGRHVVRRFLADGHRVHVPVYQEAEGDSLWSFLESRDGGLRIHPDADLTDPETVSRVLRSVEEGEGRPPEVLLNLAGGFWMGPVAETEPKVWDRMWTMNASTAFLCSRAVFAGMASAGWGRILNVSAMPALDRGQAQLSAYGAAKAAVLNLTQTLAKEGVERGITVNAVLPSIIDTPANRDAMPEADHATWVPPESIAHVLAFLASDEARIVNGAAIPLTLG